MGMDWDPEADAEQRKAGRARWWLTIGIVVVVLGYIGKAAYSVQADKERRDAMFGR